jgi:hypothetical protein
MFCGYCLAGGSHVSPVPCGSDATGAVACHKGRCRTLQAAMGMGVLHICPIIVGLQFSNSES